ncbi:hypothetical protein [Aquisphaera insulae]|uniref:hypothetical protein n=1 Tax=Aquisphaera insulae TaxID=2712864 RepID=UPI0013EC69B3|nr:hypothetical protein [Aquisphaera insulae]
MPAPSWLNDFAGYDPDEDAVTDDDAPLSEPGEPMTLAELERTVHDAERLGAAVDAGNVSLRRLYTRYQRVLMQFPGRDALLEYLTARHRERYLTRKSIDAVVLDLAQALRRTASDVEQMEVREALAMLDAQTPTQGAEPALTIDPPSATKPRVSVPILDFTAIAARLRQDGRGKAKPALLVEFMADKEQAAELDVAEAVHDTDAPSKNTVRNNAERTNAALQEMGIPLRFRVTSGYVFREILPE